MEHKKNRTSVTLLHAHLVFVVKYRRRVISDRVRDTIAAAIRRAYASLRAEAVEIDGEMDHIHVMVRYPPSVSVSDLAKRMKGASSAAVRACRFPEVARRLRGGHFWSPSYFAVSCGGAPLDAVKAYIQNQRASPEREKRRVSRN